MLNSGTDSDIQELQKKNLVQLGICCQPQSQQNWQVGTNNINLFEYSCNFHEQRST